MELCVQEPATVAQVRVVASELVPVIAQRQRRIEAAGQRLEAAEMRDPLRLGERLQPHPLRPGPVAVPHAMVGKGSGLHHVIEIAAKSGVDGGGWVRDRESGVEGKGGAVRVDLGGGRVMKKKKQKRGESTN